MMYYPTYIINRATWLLYTTHGDKGETYEQFLKRVYRDFDVDFACQCEMEAESVSD